MHITIRVKTQQLQEQKQRYLDVATSITTPINLVKVQSSLAVDRIEEALAKATDMDDNIEAKLKLFYIGGMM